MKTDPENFSYDYIIAGTGCAGLSLAMQLMRSGLPFKKVLLIDKELKTNNDRTWCFWTKENDQWFEAAVFKKWDRIGFRSPGSDLQFNLQPYTYKMIRGIDLYQLCYSALSADQRFEFRTEEILSIGTSGNTAILKSAHGIYPARYIFNSAFRNADIKRDHVNLVQHFKGWLIETPAPVFDEACPVFMDFDLAQENDCRFVYVIPHSKTRALIEYTGFSAKAADKEKYDEALANYISEKLTKGSYKVLETEQGVIPMYESSFINPFGAKVINIGTAGGCSKPSTGYTFFFIQKQVNEIISRLREGGKIPQMQRKQRYILYDRVLLDVLNNGRMEGRKVFSDLFRNTRILDLLAFLNEESTLLQDLKIMMSVPVKFFLPATLKKLLRR